MPDNSTKGFCLDRFRAEFGALMARLRGQISELDRVGAELHLQVSRFCSL